MIWASRSGQRNRLYITTRTKITSNENNQTVCILFFVCGLVLIGFGQEIKSNDKLVYKTGNPTDWNPELDVVLAVPDNHKILLENDKVRVLEVSLLPGEREPLHHHCWPSVLYIQEAGGFIDSDTNGNIIFDTRKLPEPLTFPLTMYKEPEALKNEV